MSRAVKTFTLIAFIVILAFVLGVGLFLSTHDFDDWARREATRFLEGRFQLQAHFGRMDVHLWGGSVEIDDLRLEDAAYPGPAPAVSVRHAVVNFSILDYFFNDLPLDEVSLDQLRLNLRKDPNDRLNLANMFSSGKPQPQPPESGGGFSPLKVKISAIRLHDAKVSYQDRLITFNTDSEAFHLNLSFDRTIPAYQGSIDLNSLQMQVDNFPIPLTDFQGTFEVGEDSIRFESIRTSSDALTSQLSGAITSFSPFTFDFDVEMSANLPRFQKPDLGAIFEQGEVDLEGQVQGGSGKVDFDGSAHSNLLVIKGIALRNLVSKVHVDQDKAEVNSMQFSVLGGSGQATSRIWWDASRQSSADLTSQGIQLSQALEAFDVQGLPLEARNRLTAHLSWPGVEVGEFAGPGRVISQGELTGSLDDRQESIPFSAKASLEFGEGRIRFSDGSVDMAQTNVTSSGHVDFQGVTTLSAEVHSQSSREIWTIGRLFGLLPEDVMARYEVAVQGAFNAQVNLERQPDTPVQMEGWAETASVVIRGEPEGHLRAGFRLLPNEIDIHDLKLVRSDSRLDADLVLDREPVALQSVRVETRRIPLAELARLGLVDPSLDLSGRASVQADFDVGQDWTDLSGSGSIQLDDARLYGVTVPVVKAQARVQNQTVRLSGLQARAWGGSVDGRGSYDLNSQAFQLSLEGKDIALDQSPLKRNEPKVTGNLTVSLKGSGTLDSPNATVDLHSSRIQYGSETFSELDVQASYRNGEASVSAKAGYLGEPVHAKGTVQVASPYAFQAEAEIPELGLTPFLKEFTTFQLSDFSGKVGVSAQASGNLSDLASIQAKGSLPTLEVSVGDYDVHLSQPMSFSFQNDLLTVNQTGLTGRDTDLRVGGTANFKQSQLNFKVGGNLNLRLVNAFLDQGDVQGELQLETNIGGWISEPKVVGSASLSGLFLGMPSLPVSIQNGHGQFKFTANQVSIDSFSGQTSYGEFSASGGIFMDGFVPVRWQINATANSVTIPYPEGFTTVLDADVDFAKGDKGELLSGAVYIRSAEYSKDITIPQLILQLGRANPAPSGGGEQGAISLDISVEAHRSLRVNNNLAEITASGNFSVVGTVANPVVLGSLTIEEGTLKLEGNQYQITRGTVSFDNPRKTSPYFNFEAETQVREYDISILIHGPVDQLQLSFRSEPPLSTSNIVSLLAAGQTEQEILGATGAATSSGTLAAFGAGTLLTKTLGAAVESQASRLFGIDRFSIDPFVDDTASRDPGARITLGKQITQDLGISYVSSLANSFQEQTVIIEYRLTDWLTAVGTSQTDGTVAIDFKLRKRF